MWTAQVRYKRSAAHGSQSWPPIPVPRIGWQLMRKSSHRTDLFRSDQAYSESFNFSCCWSSRSVIVNLWTLPLSTHLLHLSLKWVIQPSIVKSLLNRPVVNIRRFCCFGQANTTFVRGTLGYATTQKLEYSTLVSTWRWFLSLNFQFCYPREKSFDL